MAKTTRKQLRELKEGVGLTDQEAQDKIEEMERLLRQVLELDRKSPEPINC
jgi:hypothetical protein